MRAERSLQSHGELAIISFYTTWLMEGQNRMSGDFGLIMESWTTDIGLGKYWPLASQDSFRTFHFRGKGFYKVCLKVLR